MFVRNVVNKIHGNVKSARVPATAEALQPVIWPGAPWCSTATAYTSNATNATNIFFNF